MIRLISHSQHFHPLREGESLPGLDEALKPLCREPFRRIDRFIQLALLGSARCVAGQALQTDCGLYIGSGLGPMSNNIASLEQLVRGRELPKPFNFINTLGSSAGFYVARNLGLTGQNVFVSRRQASFEALLSAALADLESGVLPQALVGVVEEVTLPLADQRERQGLTPDLPLAEGSHWLLLERDATRGGTVTYTRHAEFAELSAAAREPVQVFNSLDMASEDVAVLRGVFPSLRSREADEPFHDSLAAAWIGEALQRKETATLVEGGAGHWHLFHFNS